MIISPSSIQEFLIGAITNHWKVRTGKTGVMTALLRVTNHRLVKEILSSYPAVGSAFIANGYTLNFYHEEVKEIMAQLVSVNKSSSYYAGVLDFRTNLPLPTGNHFYFMKTVRNEDLKNQLCHILPFSVGKNKITLKQETIGSLINYLLQYGTYNEDFLREYLVLLDRYKNRHIPVSQSELDALSALWRVDRIPELCTQKSVTRQRRAIIHAEWIIEKKRIKDLKSEQKKEKDARTRRKKQLKREGSLERQRIRKEKIAIRKTTEDKERKEKMESYSRLLQHEKSLIPLGQCYCRKCQQDLPLAAFCKGAHTHTGYNLYCKSCCRKDHYLPRKKELTKRVREWQAANRDKVKETERKQRKKPHNRIKQSLTKTVKEYLRGKGLLDTYRSLINCSPKQLVSHIESKFTSAMSWENYGSYWHLDHIIPCAAFDWVIKSHIHWCWDHRNLQPLPAAENVMKSDSLPSGESARNLRETNMERLKEVVGPLLEQAGIATATEYAKSWDEVKEPICLAI